MYIFKTVLEEVIGDAMPDPQSATSCNLNTDMLYRAFKFAAKTKLTINHATDWVIIFSFSDGSELTHTLVNMRLEEIAELKHQLASTQEQLDEIINNNIKRDVK